MPGAKVSDAQIKRGLRLMRRLAKVCHKLGDDKSLMVMKYAIKETEALLAGEPSLLSRERIQKEMNKGMH